MWEKRAGRLRERPCGCEASRHNFRVKVRIRFTVKAGIRHAAVMVEVRVGCVKFLKRKSLLELDA